MESINSTKNLFKKKIGINSQINFLSSNQNIASLCKSYGMKIMNVSWEDTGRTKNSCFGPNISDMTLNVSGQNMPIIRKPNFADITSDQPIDSFKLVVGNEKPQSKQLITLKEYLDNINKYTDIETKSLYNIRDKVILTSAQACILPIENKEVTFNIKLYNYQSYFKPAVLIIVASSEGTSAQIVYGRDCNLFFNKNGKNANFIAERLSDDRKKRGVSQNGTMTNDEKQRNALLIFQIPLVRKSIKSYIIDDSDSEDDCDSDDDCVNNRGFENAVLKSGESFGKFLGSNGEKIVRDEKLPIRCTIQYYKVTDTLDISENMIREISEQINKHFKAVDNKGSLVIETSNRKTEHQYDETPLCFGTNSMMTNL